MGYSKGGSKGGSGTKIVTGTPHTVQLGKDKRTSPAVVKRKSGK